MKNSIDKLFRAILVASLCLFCSAALAVPKAAEQEEDSVTFGDAGAPPKRTTKAYPPAASKTSPPVRQAEQVKKKSRTAAKSGRTSTAGKAVAKPGKAHPTAIKKGGSRKVQSRSTAGPRQAGRAGAAKAVGPKKVRTKSASLRKK